MFILRISALLAALVSFQWVGNNPQTPTQSRSLSGMVESGSTADEPSAPVKFACSVCG